MSSWKIDPANGDYLMGTNGAPQDTDDLKEPAYIRLKVKRNLWLYAPNNQYGSDFHLQKKRKSTQDASFYETLAERALQPIVDDGRAQSITVTALVSTRNGIGMQTDIVDARGKEEKIVVNSLGV